MPALRCMVSRLTLEHPERNRPYCYDGVLLFADVSGFTALTEALTREGPEGSELLSRLLGDYFTPLIAQIDAHGGYLTGFAGDALTVLFHAQEPGGDGPELRGLRCAMALQEATARFSARDTPIGQVNLSIKIGLAPGRLFTSVVGSPVLGQLLIAYGPGLSRATAAEKRAYPGDICLDDALSGELPGASYAPVGDGILRLTQWTWAPVVLPMVPKQSATPQALRDHIPPAIWPYLSKGAGAFLNSIRSVTALFIGFEDLSDLREARHAALADYIKGVQEIVDSYRGFFAGYDGSDKGNTLIALFGAPIAVESPADRALACALEIQAAAEQIEAIRDLRIGITTGSLYVGLVGGGSQRRYTALGDPMNLAARLMTQGEGGQILLDRATALASSGAFEWSAPQTITVKGKDRSVEIRALSGLGASQPRRHPKRGRGLVGRDLELRHLRECTEAAVMGQGNVVLITGEAGLGKSRLLSPLISQAEDTLGATVLVTRSADYTQGSAYQPFWPILRHLLGLPPGVEASAEALEAAGDALGVRILGERRSLLAYLLGAEGGADWAQRPPGETQALMEELTLELMTARHPQAPLFLIFEDAQWLDTPSISLLQRIASRVEEGPFLLVIVSRTTEEGALLPWQRTLLEHTKSQHLPLSPLSDEDIRRHACARMRASSVGPDVLKVLVERSVGNPLVLEEICDLLRQMSQVVVTRGVARLTLKPHELTVPKGLGELVLARMESLDTPTRIALQVASVLGQRFTLEDLEAVHPGPAEPAAIRGAIQAAHALDIIRVERGTELQAYFFKHVLAREAIYSSLTFELRRRLHGIIARHLEGRLAGQERRTLVPLIAEHYRSLDDREKLSLYAMEAGTLAMARRMNRIGAMWFMIAADVHHERGEASLEGEALRLAFESMQILGDLEEQGQILLRWEDLGWALDDDPMLSRVYLAKVSYLHRRGESGPALEAAEDAADILGELKESQELARLALKVSTIHLETQDLAQARGALERARDHLREDPDPDLEIRLTCQEGLLAAFGGENEAALFIFNRALKLIRPMQHADSRAHILGNLGIIEIRLNRYAPALTHLDKAAEICHRLGSLRQEGRQRFNLAYLLMNLGDLPRAEVELARARQLFERTDWQQGLQAVLINLLRLCWLTGEAEEARHVATRLQVLLPGAPPPILAEYYWNLGELALREGAWQMAVGEFGNCLELAKETELTIWQQQALEGRAEARLRQGELQRAGEDSLAAMALFPDASAELEWPSRSWFRRAHILSALQRMDEAEEAWARAETSLAAFLSCVPKGEMRATAANGLEWRRGIRERGLDLRHRGRQRAG